MPEFKLGDICAKLAQTYAEAISKSCQLMSPLAQYRYYVDTVGANELIAWGTGGSHSNVELANDFRAYWRSKLGRAPSKLIRLGTLPSGHVLELTGWRPARTIKGKNRLTCWRWNRGDGAPCKAD